MPRFRFDKLIRDKIVGLQQSSGAVPHYRILNDTEHKQALVEKIIEEAREITGNEGGEVVDEIADVQQALDDLKEKYGISDEAVKKAQHVKNEKYGPFKRGMYVEEVEVAEDNQWVAYWRKNPDRYPEI